MRRVHYYLCGISAKGGESESILREDETTKLHGVPQNTRPVISKIVKVLIVQEILRNCLQKKSAWHASGIVVRSLCVLTTQLRDQDVKKVPSAAQGHTLVLSWDLKAF